MVTLTKGDISKYTFYATVPEEAYDSQKRRSRLLMNIQGHLGYDSTCDWTGPSKITLNITTAHSEDQITKLLQDILNTEVDLILKTPLAQL